MDLLHPKIHHEFKAEEGKATYKQCKLIWALCHIVGIEPVWCKGMPYGEAISLITKLETIRDIRHGR